MYDYVQTSEYGQTIGSIMIDPIEVQPSAIAYCNLLVVNLTLPYNY